MREHILNGLAFLVVVALGAGWWFQYAQPKHDTLMAAWACMADQGIDPASNRYEDVQEEWDACLMAAEEKHGTALLAVFGY